jgi:hypothetical protein
MKMLSTLILAGFLAVSVPVYAEAKKEPEVKTVCLDVQGKDGKPVIDKKTGKVKQNCVKVKVRKKFEGTAIEDAKKK